MNLLDDIDKLSLEELEELYTFVGDYDWRPVGIQEFLEGDEFLGPYFEGELYPFWKEKFLEIYPSPFYSPYWLVCLRGGIGLGKTTVACTGIAYDLYKLLCLTSPQKSLGLIESTKVVFSIFNVTMALATDVVWDQLSQMFNSSPFFSRMMAMAKTGIKRNHKADTLFPKRVDFFMGSRIGHTLGKAVYEGVIDEANFDVLHGQVYKNFNSLLRRMESRFVGSSMPGKLWVVSSETDKFSTINKIVDNYRDKKGVMVVQEPLWVVKPHQYKSDPKEWFDVYRGSDSRDPCVITDEDDRIYQDEPEGIIQVPTEHRDSFDADVHMALRDLAGIPIGSSYKLFPNRVKLSSAMEMTALFPEILTLDFDDETNIFDMVKSEGYFRRPFMPDMPRHIHIDIGLTGDKLGMAASYVTSYKDTKTLDPHTLEEIKHSSPNVVTEWAFAIQPTPGKQVPLFKIRTFIQWLSKQGVIIGGVTCDGFQSADMLQSLTKMGYKAELLSVDRTIDPYVCLRTAIHEDRCSVPVNELLKKELGELIIEAGGKKVDHPPESSKDVADAVCGSVFKAIENSSKYKLVTESGDIPDDRAREVQDMFWPGRN